MRGIFLLMLLTVISAVSLIACSETGKDEANAQLLTVVRVEERLEDGTWAPVSNATIVYEIFGSQNIAANIARYQLYEDSTDSNGMSVVLRPSEGKTASEIGMVFAAAEHPDGRSRFRRVQSDKEFDFQSWYRKFGGKDATAETIVGELCATAVDFPTCSESLMDSQLKTWGAGILIRFR